MEIKTNINEICKIQHEAAKMKGFYDNPRELGTLLMMIVSELGEVLEADRCNRWADVKAFRDETADMEDLYDKVETYETYVKDTIEDEIADVFLRLFDLCGYMGIDIDEHIAMKAWYNSTRPRLHGKAY